MITVTFKCGHFAAVKGDETPRCVCGETAIAKVKAKPPKFRGLCRGAHASYEQLPAVAVDLKGAR